MDKTLQHKESERLEFLNKLILDVSCKQGNNDLLETVLTKIAEIVGIDFGYIAKYTKEDIIIRNVEEKYNVPDGFFEEMGSCWLETAKVANTIRETIRKKGFIMSEEDFETIRQKYISSKYNFKTLIIIPIGYNDSSTTELMLLFSHKEKELLVEHLYFLETLGNTLRIHIQKQRMHEEYQKSIIKIEKIRVLGELSGGVVHDFNNSLTTILGFSQIALASGLSEDVKEYMEIIQKSALDGKKIVERIQRYARKQLNDNKDVYTINSIVESSIEMIRPRWKNFYESYGIELRLIKELNSASKIYCLEHEIREVMINLLSNAMDAMEDGGTLTIRTNDIGDKVVVEIGDTGIGIPEEIKKEVFNPFYSTKGTKGTGLGLSIVKKIVENHNGTMQLESTIGEGTIFKLFFERYLGEPENIEVTKPDLDINLNIAKDLNILVVDDLQQVGETVVKMLETIGIHAELETVSEKVIHRLLQKKYEIIICDLAMPELNGAELSQIVKKGYSKTKFIIATGWPERFKDKDYKSIDYILDKPFTIEDLARAINSVLQLHKE